MDYNSFVPTIPNLKNFKPLAQKIAEDNYASSFSKHIIEQLNEFNDNLNEEDEVGICLANFGQVIQFPVRGIGYKDPSLIIFYGIDEDGCQHRLIQHVSQINFALTSFKRNKPEVPKVRIGFIYDGE